MRSPGLRGPLKPGDIVIRRRRYLTTRGTILRLGQHHSNGAARAWVKWDHPTTLPNPSLEMVDDLDRAAASAAPLVEEDRRSTT